MKNVSIVVIDTESGEGVTEAIRTVNTILGNMPKALFYEGSGDYVIAAELAVDNGVNIDGDELAKHVTRALIIDNIMFEGKYQVEPCDDELKGTEGYDDEIARLYRTGEDTVLYMELVDFPMYRFMIVYPESISDIMEEE